MLYSVKTETSSTTDTEKVLGDSLIKIVNGLGLELIELNIFRRKGNVQVRLTVFKGIEPVSINDCSMVHKAVLPKLEVFFINEDDGITPRIKAPDIYLEVSSPGIDRLIKEGREFKYYIGRNLKCYRIDLSAWITGKLISSDQKEIKLETEDRIVCLTYELIGKARLSD